MNEVGLDLSCDVERAVEQTAHLEAPLSEEPESCHSLREEGEESPRHSFKDRRRVNGQRKVKDEEEEEVTSCCEESSYNKHSLERVAAYEAEEEERGRNGS